MEVLGIILLITLIPAAGVAAVVAAVVAWKVALWGLSQVVGTVSRAWRKP
jgi:hypothetical protein